MPAEKVMPAGVKEFKTMPFGHICELVLVATFNRAYRQSIKTRSKLQREGMEGMSVCIQCGFWCVLCS